jgi:hypothetical protein
MHANYQLVSCSGDKVQSRFSILLYPVCFVWKGPRLEPPTFIKSVAMVYIPGMTRYLARAGLNHCILEFDGMGIACRMLLRLEPE